MRQKLNYLLVFGLLIATLGTYGISNSGLDLESIRGPLYGGESEENSPLDPDAPQKLIGPIVTTYPAPASFNGDLRKISHTPIIRKAERPEVGSPVRPQAQGTSISSTNIQSVSIAAPNASNSFEGLDYATWGAGHPADPNGDVGPNHYIEGVNTSIGIFDKATGTQSAAFTFNDFFTTAGQANNTPCATQNYGDPYVLFDRYSQRWFISDFAFASPSTGPYYQCIAVSKTDNPVTGGWWLYSFQVSSTRLNDYPKFASWSDGIYMTTNLFTSGRNYYGTQATVFNRAALISGGALSTVSFVLPYTAGYGYPFSLLAANDVSTTATGPEYLFSDWNGLKQWTFSTNWVNPTSSTLSTPVAVAGAPSYSNASGAAPQPNGQGLDQLGDRLMSAAQWSNSSVWLTRSVATATKTGVLWMELNSLGAGVKVKQSGIFDPADGKYRYMPSLAVNNSGTMVIGYSTSSSTNYPSLAYAARSSQGTSGQLDLGEGILFDGSGSQTSYSRWGDYYSMSVDPADSCTFWMTGSYMSDTSANWKTRIIKFTPVSPCSQVVAPAPTITDVSPNTGSIGTAVTITGTGFTDTTSVTFNGKSAIYNVISTTSITATVPNLASTGKIAVTTPRGTAASTTDFTVTQLATLLTYTGPTSSRTNSNVTFTATLKTSLSPTPISSKTVTFTFNGKNYSAVTNASGVASVTVKSPPKPGTLAITLRFAGDSTYSASSGSGSIQIK